MRRRHRRSAAEFHIAKSHYDKRLRAERSGAAKPGNKNPCSRFHKIYGARKLCVRFRASKSHNNAKFGAKRLRFAKFCWVCKFRSSKSDTKFRGV